MRTLFFLCCFFPLVCFAQKLKFNAWDNNLQQWRAETFPVTLKSNAELKMDVSLRMIDTSLNLRLAGSGIGTNTIDVGSRLVLLLSNDDTISGVSRSVQPIDYGEMSPVYRHDYQFAYEDMEQLARNDVKWIRKYSAGGYDDIKIEQKNAVKLRQLSALFITELKKANALNIKPAISQPGFPGGKQVLLTFLNRNLKTIPDLRNGERKTAIVEFQVTDDGSITNFRIKQSAGTSLDNELLRILQRMPKWKPALQNGKQVEALVTQPVTFFKADTGLKVEF